MPSHFLRLSLLSAVTVSAAYLIEAPSSLPLGSFFVSAPFLEGFHDAEEGYRWTRARSCITFPDPGPSGRGRIELELSGFRPRGQEPPVAFLEVAGKTERIATPRRFETVSTPVPVDGWLSTDVALCIRSETFSPGSMDQRALGIRIARARFVPEGRGLAPLGQIGFTAVIGWFVFSTLSVSGRSPKRSGILAALVVLALGCGYVSFRPHTALLAPPLAALAFLTWCWARFAPASFAFTRELLAALGLALARGLRRAASSHGVGLALFAAVAVTLAFVSRPKLVIDMGSGLEAPLVQRFGAPDGEAGVKFRQALSGAEVDLRDFGGASTWRIDVTSSLPTKTEGSSESIAVFRADGAEGEAELGPDWRTSTLVARAPFGWRSGLRLELPSASPSVPIRIDRIEIDRGRALPSIRLVAMVAGAALALLAAAAAAGLAPWQGLLLCSLLVLLESLGLLLDPVGFVPSTGPLLLIALAAFAGVAVGGGAIAVAKARRLELHLSSSTLFVAAIGFIVWMSAMSYPLYSGRHFVYHSNIAEEIWKGKFLVFYLPHPDNILSREAQWGGLVVPYPCLYHTLVAPLTALPAAWFEFAHKLFQASLLAVLALVASALGSRFSGKKAGFWAGVTAVSLVSSFQLLGLAHFLTVFGCAMSSLALGFVAMFLERLPQRRFFWGAVGLTSLAFLSYTSSLLFTAVALAAAVPLVHRMDRELARRLASATLAAVAIAFVLYYVHWVLPFWRESVPILLASDQAEGSFPLLTRLLAAPRKLSYSFGSAVVPLAGLVGIGLAARRARPGLLVLVTWAAIVVVFSGFDLFFNFILKHHYFVMVPVAAGFGILVAKLRESPFAAARVAAVFLITATVALGAIAAHALARGTIQ